MLPVHEYISRGVKRIPGAQSLKNITVIRKIKDRMYQNYLNKRRKNVQSYGYELIECMNEIGNELKLDIWIDWGTLLGYAREGSIIQHDYDLDFAMWTLPSDQKRKLKKALHRKGIKLVREFKLDGEVITETYEYKEILADIEYYEGNSEHAWTYAFDLNENSKVIIEKGIQKIYGMNLYRYDTFDIAFTEGKFHNGICCKIPKDTLRRVKEEYGKEWKKPIKDFDWKLLDNYKFEGYRETLVGWRKK